MTFLEFRNEVLGKAYDLDGSYGAQCWDGYAYYMQKLGYKAAYCTSSGFVKDIWENRHRNGMLNYCDEVSVMQQGDIAVFKEDAAWTPYSHIAIFVKDLGNGFGLFLGQNQGGKNGAFNEVKLPYGATYQTAFRPKCFKNLLTNKNSNNAVASSKKPDQVLHKGSIVEFCGLLRVEKYKNEKVYNSRIGGWIPTSICTEDSANDGKLDQYFANTNATFTIKGRYTATAIEKRNGVWDAYLKELGCWVHADPLIEVVDA